MDTVKISQPMPENNKCPQCGTPLPSGALAGLCPACLLKMGAAADTVTDAKQPPFNPPTVAELAPMFSQLEIIELIGKGGMGAVYKARQKQLDRLVALKILPPGIGQDAAFAERFTREAKALARLNHPGIVTLYEFGMAPGTTQGAVPLYFFLMEFVDGVNLRQLLNNGRIASREALAIVPQICDALQFAHDQGIVHRDIKPENILMDRRGRVKVADFGLAKIVGGKNDGPADGGYSAAGSTSITDAGKVMGTPNYMSPEQIKAPGEVDHRADIYALGVVFYQMLTGELPGKRIEPPSRKVQVDVRLDEIVLRAMEKDPERRYQQASVLKTQVETIVEGDADLKTGDKTQLTLAEQRILSAMKDWLVIIDDDRYAESWEAGGISFRWGINKGSWMEVLEKARRPQGNVISRKLTSLKYSALATRCEAKFETSFEGLKATAETVVFARQWSMKWKPAGYFIGYKLRQSNPAAWIKKNLLIILPVAIVILLIIRTFFLQSFRVATDAAAPEIPKGSHFLVWKLAHHFAPGDLVAYRLNGWANVGRVVSTANGILSVNRNGNADICVPDGDVLGKVVSVYWRASNTAPPPTDFFIGQKYFPEGDSIEITAVERAADTMKVKGHYDLVSHEQASLALYITSSDTNASPEGVNQTMTISKGHGDFELIHPHVVPGMPHVSMYADTAPFAALYFGTQEESAEAGKMNLSNAAETWSPSLASGKKPDIQKIREDIKNLMEQGQYADALGRQIWYFNHAVEYGESDPVRTSFGIMNWGELGRRYPRAKLALIEIRNRDVKKIEDGNGYFSLFLEVENINQQLRDDDSTYALFKTIAEKDPALAKECYPLCEDVLVKKGEYQLCLRYVGDPQARFENIHGQYDREMENEKRMIARQQQTRQDTAEMNRKNGWTNVPSFSPPDSTVMMKKLCEGRFMGQVRQLIEILVATGNESGAQKIENEAVVVLDDARLHSAVSDAKKKTAWMNWNNNQKIGSFYSVAGTARETVAVGIDGRIATRDNETGEWTVQTFKGGSNFRAVIYAGGQYVVVREHGGIMSSPDGLTWTARSSPTTANLLGLFWDGHQYLTGGDHGTILASLDGINWTQRNGGADINFYAFAYSGSCYVAAGNDGICISTDAVTWTKPATRHLTEHIPFTACVWTGNEFLACGLGLDRYPTIYTSADGDTWTLRETTIYTSLRAAITVGGAVYIAGDNVIKKSSDGGTSWEDVYLNTDNNNLFMGLAYNGQKIIAAGFNHNVFASETGAGVEPQPASQAEWDLSSPIKAINDWLSLIDAGKYSESWDAAAESFRNAVTIDEWSYF